jgi:ATP-dependent DNA helicase PIF1
MSFVAENYQCLFNALLGRFPRCVVELIVDLKGNEYHSLCETAIHEQFIAKENLFITGVGGTGKSYQLKCLYEYCMYNGLNIALTSTTGKSAVSIGGTTIHYWSGIRTGEYSVETLLSLIKKNPDAKRRWCETDILVIDEVSMLGGSVLDKLDKIAQIIRKNERVFGGMQIVFSGDFLQLKPIKDCFSFTANAWDELDLVYLRLNTPHRFSDKSYHRMLLRIRKGKPTKRDIKRLKSRIVTWDEVCDMESDVKPTILFSHRADVADINEEELKNINSQEYIYTSSDKIEYKNKKKREGKIEDLDLITGFKKILDKSVEKTIKLKVGAQVMLNYNIDIDRELVNGARGVVIACYVMSVDVKFDNGVTVNIGINKWTVETKECTIVREQIPLILAWAMTLHKSQGATISKVVTSLSYDIFAAGMAYLALSRCKNLESIFLLEFDPRRIYADKEALEFEEQFE